MPCLVGSSPHLGVNILIQQMLWSHRLLWPERYPMVWKIRFTVIDQFAGSSFQDNQWKENHGSPPFVYICTYVCMYVCIYIYIERERESLSMPAPQAFRAEKLSAHPVPPHPQYAWFLIDTTQIILASGPLVGWSLERSHHTPHHQSYHIPIVAWYRLPYIQTYPDCDPPLWLGCVEDRPTLYLVHKLG